MINLRSYYLDNCEKEDYYYKWYKQIKENYIEEVDYRNVVPKSDPIFYDDNEVIKQYKLMLYPDATLDYLEFILFNFYLKNEDYIIEKFPEQLERPSNNFSNEIRQYMIVNKVVDYEKLEKVTWQSRRIFIDEMKIIKKNVTNILSKQIDSIFKMISTRNNGFNEMNTDEKLQEIANCLMLLIDKYEYPNFSENINEYISKNKLSSLKGNLQCFRHSEEWALEKRKNFSEIDKQILIEIGIIYVNSYKKLLEEDE